MNQIEKIIDIATWNRREHYEHFSAFDDPFFGVTVPIFPSTSQCAIPDEKSGFASRFRSSPAPARHAETNISAISAIFFMIFPFLLLWNPGFNITLPFSPHNNRIV